MWFPKEPSILTNSFNFAQVFFNYLKKLPQIVLIRPLRQDATEYRVDCPKTRTTSFEWFWCRFIVVAKHTMR